MQAEVEANGLRGQFLTTHSYIVPNQRSIVFGGVLDLRTTYAKRKLSLQQLWALQLFAKWANLKGVRLSGEQRPIQLVGTFSVSFVRCGVPLLCC